MNPKIMYITNNNLYTILKNNNILDRNDKHSAEERIKSVLRVAFEEDGHSPDAFEQLKNAAKLAIEVVQDNINHGGGTKQILTEHIAEKLGGNPKAIELFDKLIRNNRFDLEITSAHRWHLLGNRKLSFFSISYTNTNQSLLNFIDKLDNFSKVDFLSFLPHEVNLNILKYLPASDQKTFRLVNSIATSLVDDKHNSSNPLATVKLNRSITATKSKFDRFLKYLASSHCKITSLDLSQIRATHKSFRGFSLEKLIISLNKNTSIISLNITGCDLYDEDLELIGGIPKLKKVIMTNGMDDDTKIKILSANDSWGNPKLYLALRIGNIGLVIALTKAILSSKLPQEVKSKLLAARNHGIPGLYRALQEGYTEAVAVYTTAILNSELPNPEKIELLVAKRADGDPGLYAALENRRSKSALPLIMQLVQLKINLLTLNEWMILDIPEVGCKLHGLLVAIARDNKFLRDLNAILLGSQPNELYQEIIKTYEPIIAQRYPLGKKYLRILDCSSSEEFWNKMSEALKLVKRLHNGCEPEPITFLGRAQSFVSIPYN